MTETIVLAIIGALQAATLGYLENNRRKAKRVCGSAACVKAIGKALGLKLENSD